MPKSHITEGSIEYNHCGSWSRKYRLNNEGNPALPPHGIFDQSFIEFRNEGQKWLLQYNDLPGYSAVHWVEKFKEMDYESVVCRS